MSTTVHTAPIAPPAMIAIEIELRRSSGRPRCTSAAANRSARSACAARADHRGDRAVRRRAGAL